MPKSGGPPHRKPLNPTERKKHQVLAPGRSMVVVDIEGPVEVSQQRIRPDLVGLKAYGLAALPQAWTLPFFVVRSKALMDSDDARIEGWLKDAVERTGVNPAHGLIVRSSGISETLRMRGRLPSSRCHLDGLYEKVGDLMAQVPVNEVESVHWIVQQYALPRMRGHFSNERRLSYEKRDWIVSVEMVDGKEHYTSPVAYRPWRDGRKHHSDPLLCRTETRISVSLKQVAIWASQFSHRVHIEWIWTGTQLLLVQVDREEAGGTKPQDTVPASIPKVDVSGLVCFRKATTTDFKSYGKLRNAAVYESLGYEMPPFFVLDEPSLLKAILTGQVPESVAKDLDVLARRPLVIRTDGREVPEHRREMLPRSESLYSGAGAVEWLRQQFSAKVLEYELFDASLALIVHHYIPAIASAWARAEPGKPIVRVEALWGIPEGLYWYAHDTYQLDTGIGGRKLDGPVPHRKFEYTKRLRYKGLFVAPDEQGRWLPFQTAAPYDWSSSVGTDRRLAEIAWNTRRVAEQEGYPVSVMWFIGNHRHATRHPVLPWFHSRLEISETPRAAPAFKYRTSRDYVIENEDDWHAFQGQLGRADKVERVVVKPTDTRLIRNARFVDDLAQVATRYNIVVELSGGILTHAYYILTRAGATVECVDLYGHDEELMEFDKLIRDNISTIISSRGERAQTVKLVGDALIEALKRKLVEEAFEALDTRSGEALIGELADIVEVALALCDAVQVDRKRLEAERRDKARRRGGFAGGVMLIRTASPGSAASRQGSGSGASGLNIGGQSPPVIEDPQKLPARRTLRRPDLRRSEAGLLERLLSIEFDITQVGDIKESTSLVLEGIGSGDIHLQLGIDIRRSRAALKVTGKVLQTPLQLDLLATNC